MTGSRRPLLAPFRPYAWQVSPWRDTSPIVLLTGSAGGGKSRLAAEKIHAYCLRYPGAMAMVLRKTRQSLANSTVLFLEREIIGGDPSVRHVTSRHHFAYDNGSILAYGGMADEEQREHIRSIGSAGGLDYCWMEEANKFSEDDYNEVLPRMRGTAAPWRQVLLSTNPDHPDHWIRKRLILGGEAHVYYSSATDNLANPADYIETLARLTGVQGKRLREGLWCQAEGIVYEDWDDSVHLIEKFSIPDNWPRYRSIDYGHTNPFVCQWWAEDPDGRLYRYRELYKTGMDIADAAAEIERLSSGERITATIADIQGEIADQLHNHGLSTVYPIKHVAAGIGMVNTRLRRAPDGKPRLYLMRDALTSVDRSLESRRRPTCTEEEILQYVWPRDVGGKSLKEEPVKENDHGCDAMRYMVAYKDDRPSTTIEHTNYLRKRSRGKKRR